MKRYSVWMILGTALMAGCSSCSCHRDDLTDGTEETSETGTHTSETSTTTGTIEDTSTTSESNTETGDTTTGEPWIWEDLPLGEDCGAGCRQVSFSEGVPSDQWDVFDNLLVYNGTGAFDKMGPQEHWLQVVNFKELKTLLIPNVHPGISKYATGIPTVFDNKIYYAWQEWSADADMSYGDLIAVNLEEKKQEIFYSLSGIDVEIGEGGWAELDAGARGLVTQGGCGDLTDGDLCYFPFSGFQTPQVLVSSFGSHATFIDNKVLYYTGDYDIHLYDVDKGTVLKITDDQYWPSQLMARMHGNKVVYQDLRFGEGDGMGNWNHSAVFLYDLETKEYQQITSGDWIACNPDIYGEIVVWLDFRDASNPNDKSANRGAEIWGYNLKTKVMKQITHFPNQSKVAPRIWGEKVFVHMLRSDPTYDSIFMIDLPAELK